MKPDQDFVNFFCHVSPPSALYIAFFCPLNLAGHAQLMLSGLCRALQGDPFGAVFHDRIKMSTGGHRLKIEQKFQLLAPGVMPVKHHSIWQRIEETN